jgi:ABC-type iron transport system FetAB ATPase subunit
MQFSDGRSSYNPKVMLLDEITAVIDIEGQKNISDQLKNYTSRGGDSCYYNKYSLRIE